MASEDTFEPDAAPASRAELQALANRIAILERQVDALRRPVSRSITTSPLTARASVPAPPPLPVFASEAPAIEPNTSFVPNSKPAQSLESRLGSQIFNRLGVLILLLGTAFFLKLAVDRGWIVPTPAGRVIAGLIAGTALVLWSERFRRRGFASFSYSLKALGSSVLYLTLWAALHLFHLLPAPVALALMIAVTAWNAWMALSQDSELLAGYALAGGFLTPLLLSTGGDHEAFLFTYLFALDLATVLLVRVKAWPRLLAGAFPLTMVYFVAWYAQYFRPESLALTTIFILLFDSIFSSVPIRRTPPPVAPDERFRAFGTLLEDVLIPLANAAFLALSLYSVLQDSGHHDLLPWLMILLAAVYLGFMRLPQSRTAAAIHLSIAIVLLTIAIPLKASGHWITASWLVEGLALLWVATRLAPTQHAVAEPGEDYAARVLQMLSVIALALGISGIVYHLYLSNSDFAIALPANDLATALLGLTVLAGVIALSLRSARSHHASPFWINCAIVATVAFNLVAILTGIREIDGLWSVATADSALRQSLAISAYVMLYGAALLAVGFYRRSAFLRWQALILLIVSILKAFLYDMRNLNQGYRVASFFGLGALLMTISFAYQKDWLALKEAGDRTEPQAPQTDPEAPR